MGAVGGEALQRYVQAAEGPLRAGGAQEGPARPGLAAASQGLEA